MQWFAAMLCSSNAIILIKVAILGNPLILDAAKIEMIARGLAGSDWREHLSDKVDHLLTTTQIDEITEAGSGGLLPAGRISWARICEFKQDRQLSRARQVLSKPPILPIPSRLKFLSINKKYKRDS
jgi:hypothetical protein